MILALLHYAYGAAAIVALTWLIWSQLAYERRHNRCRRVIREYEEESDWEAEQERFYRLLADSGTHGLKRFDSP